MGQQHGIGAEAVSIVHRHDGIAVDGYVSNRHTLSLLSRHKKKKRTAKGRPFS
jgi:hypothetical protein